MALGMELGLGPGHIVLDGDPAPLPKEEAEPLNFRPILIVTKRLDATWYGGRPQPRRLVLDGDPVPLPKKGRSHPIFGPRL